jgi:hypothetical protein
VAPRRPMCARRGAIAADELVVGPHCAVR